MKVAFGKTSVTPDDAIGRAMAGYYRKYKARGILDTLHARAVLIEDKDPMLKNVTKRLLLVSIDTIKVPLVFTDYIKEKLKEELGIAPGCVLIHAIHSHASLDLTGEYYYPGGLFNTLRGIMFGMNRNDKFLVWMARQVVEMVRGMTRALVPCKIAWDKKILDECVAYNRRHWQDPVHSEMGVICFKHALTGELLGFVANFAAHPTILPHSNHLISAEWPGKFLEKIDNETGGTIKALFFQNAAGDISPSFKFLRGAFKAGVAKARRKKNLRRKIKIPIERHYASMTEYGYRIGEKALKIARSVPDDRYFDTLDITCYTRTAWIPIADYKEKYWTWMKPLNRFFHAAKKYFLLPVVFGTTAGHHPNFPGLAIKHRGIKDATCYTKLQYFRCVASPSNGNLEAKDGTAFCVLGVPGEPLSAWGKALQEKTPEGAKNAFLFQMSNDWMAYLFDFEEYKRGGGEPMESLTPVAGKHVQEQFFALLDEIQAGLSGGHS